jgi:hypothetical protein
VKDQLMKFDTKIAVILREDLPVWQKLNMTAFLVSGIGVTPGVLGENYEDASGNVYLPMFVQPVLVFSATAEQLRTAYQRLMEQNARISVFTEELFSTGHDEANRVAVKAVRSEDLNLTGLAVRDNKKVVDAAVKGLTLHR